MGISNTFATIPGIVSPGLTGIIVSDQVNKSNVNDNELYLDIILILDLKNAFILLKLLI